MITKQCEYCGKEIKVKEADVKRGWGRFCNKSCKAKWQVKYNPKSKYKKYKSCKTIETGLTEDSSTGTFFTTIECCEFCGYFDCRCD
jgi:hypothetical protein